MAGLAMCCATAALLGTHNSNQNVTMNMDHQELQAFEFDETELSALDDFVIDETLGTSHIPDMLKDVYGQAGPGAAYGYKKQFALYR